MDKKENPWVTQARADSLNYQQYRQRVQDKSSYWEREYNREQKKKQDRHKALEKQVKAFPEIMKKLVGKDETVRELVDIVSGHSTIKPRHKKPVVLDRKKVPSRPSLENAPTIYPTDSLYLINPLPSSPSDSVRKAGSIDTVARPVVPIEDKVIPNTAPPEAVVNRTNKSPETKVPSRREASSDKGEVPSQSTSSSVVREIPPLSLSSSYQFASPSLEISSGNGVSVPTIVGLDIPETAGNHNPPVSLGDDKEINVENLFTESQDSTHKTHVCPTCGRPW